MPRLKYPPGIITTTNRSNDRLDSTLIQRCLNEALDQAEGDRRRRKKGPWAPRRRPLTQTCDQMMNSDVLPSSPVQNNQNLNAVFLSCSRLTAQNYKQGFYHCRSSAIRVLVDRGNKGKSIKRHQIEPAPPQTFPGQHGARKYPHQGPRQHRSRDMFPRPICQITKQKLN